MNTTPPDISYESVLKTHDLVWDRLPTRWEEGPFAGSGLVGTIMWYCKQSHRLKFLISRSDVGKLDFPGKARAPIRTEIGTLDLCLKQDVAITACNLRLDLWNAEIRGTLTTSSGSLQLHLVCPSGSSGIVITLDNPEEIECEWQAALLPQGTYGKADGNEIFEIEDFVAHERTSTKSGGFAVAWRQTPVSSQGQRMICTVGSTPVNRKLWNPNDTGESAREEAQAELEQLIRQSPEEQQTQHRNWWHTFYQRSFLSIPNHELESLYWIQLYKFASATRPDRPMLDNHGVWSTEGVYGFSTWDFNVQATYRINLTANMAEFGKPFLHFMEQSFNKETMWRPEANEFRAGMRQQCFLRYRFFDTVNWEHAADAPCDGPAKFLWGVHSYMLHARHLGDEEMLPRLLLMLEAGINAMLAGMRLEEDGCYHIPSGHSWESWKGRDPTVLLAVLKWALNAAVETGEHLDTDSAKLEKWRELRGKISPYPEDSNGFLLGEGQPPWRHRHWSQLMMLFPLDNHDLGSRNDQDKMRRSIDTWAHISSGLDGNKPAAGFACPAAICLYAWLNASTKAENLNVIERLFDIYMYGKSERGPCLWPNTMYREYGPVIETPIFVAASMQECLLQSRNSGIHVFPAPPPAWADAVFHNWHAEGGFLVSARRKGGMTDWIRVTSEYRNTLRLHTDMDGAICHADGKPCTEDARVNLLEDGALTIALEVGESILLSRAAQPDTTIAAVDKQYGHANSFGMNSRFYEKRPFFFDTFEPISIKEARELGLPLNPS